MPYLEYGKAFQKKTKKKKKKNKLKIQLSQELLLSKYLLFYWIVFVIKNKKNTCLVNLNVSSEARRLSPKQLGPGLEVCKLFSCSTQLSMKFSLLINMKMPTSVGIFIFISRGIFILSHGPRWLSWMRRPTGDQEVAGSTPAEVGNILSWRLIMKYFLRSFSPFRWFKKGSCQFLAKECAQYWLTA